MKEWKNMIIGVKVLYKERLLRANWRIFSMKTKSNDAGFFSTNQIPESTPTRFSTRRYRNE